MKKCLFIIFSFCALVAFADIPSGYYNSIQGKKGGKNLVEALHTIISTNYHDVGYNGLYNVYKTADVRSDGKVWDIYSTCDFTHGEKQCGSDGYSNVCDCYNREHTVPQSWFNKESPMVSDAFHIYPTDGKVNGQRNNYPYGECSSGNSLGGKAQGKLGSSTFTGAKGEKYNGKVFEPVDEYKGDLARSYFYMVVRYFDKNFTNGSGSVVFQYNNSRASLTNYALALFMKWHIADPVSQKEIDRNNAIYKHQNNRNPFIDYPCLVDYIFGDKQEATIDLATLAKCQSSGEYPDPNPNPNPNPSGCQDLNQNYNFKNANDFNQFTTNNVKGTKTSWSNNNYGAIINAYNKSDGEQEDWLISPAFDLSDRDLATVTFNHNIYYNNGGDKSYEQMQTLWFSTNYNDGNPNNATWEQIIIENYAVKNWVSNTITVPQKYLTTNFRFAFKYLADANSTTTGNYWEIESASLYAHCSPNATDVETTEVDLNAPTEIYNLLGQKITNDISTLQSGIYIVKQGKKVTKICVR